jgi:hypothetical protein
MLAGACRLAGLSALVLDYAVGNTGAQRENRRRCRASTASTSALFGRQSVVDQIPRLTL